MVGEGCSFLDGFHGVDLPGSKADVGVSIGPGSEYGQDCVGIVGQDNIALVEGEGESEGR